MKTGSTVELDPSKLSKFSLSLPPRDPDVDNRRLGHVLRLLATFHWLREVTPDVFANNRLSSYIDSGKSYEQLKTAYAVICNSSFPVLNLLLSSPGTKYDATDGVAAYCATA